MDNRNFHQRFLDSLNQRDWQLGALVAVPLAGFLLAETVSALLPEGAIEDRCARAVRTQITERLVIGAMVFDVGRTEVVRADDGTLTVEIDIEANGVPIRAAYRCIADDSAKLTVDRLWTRRV
jgi:hypothetical protein